jgi:hypothetical protein
MPAAEHIGESAPIRGIMKMFQGYLVPASASLLYREFQQDLRIRVIECDTDSSTGVTPSATERFAAGTTRTSPNRGIGRWKEVCEFRVDLH